MNPLIVLYIAIPAAAVLITLLIIVVVSSPARELMMSELHELYTEYSKMSIEEKIEYLAGKSRIFRHRMFPDIPELSIEEHRESMRRCYEDAGMIERRQAGGSQ